MMDVEKYGVVGLLFVAGILGLVLFFGPDDEVDAGGTELKTEAAAAAARPAGGAQRAPRPGSRPGSGNASRVEFAPSDPRRNARDGAGESGNGPIVYDMAPPVDTANAPRFDFADDALSFADSAPAPRGGRCTYVIQSGDTLGHIAKRELGSATRADDLLAWNPGLDPRRLKVDLRIRICPPGRDAPSPSSASSSTAAPAPKPASEAASGTLAAKTYTVQPGDVLSVLAEKLLGSSKQYTDDLFQANRHLMSSPDQLAPGMVLRLPKVGKLADS